MAQDPDFSGVEKRRARRCRVILNAKIRTADGVLYVRLRNLSQVGALLLADRPPVPGDDVTFEREGTVAEARVVWSGKSSFGIEFLSPIEENELLRHVQPQANVGHDYPAPWLTVPAVEPEA